MKWGLRLVGYINLALQLNVFGIDPPKFEFHDINGKTLSLEIKSTLLEFEIAYKYGPRMAQKTKRTNIVERKSVSISSKRAQRPF